MTTAAPGDTRISCVMLSYNSAKYLDHSLDALCKAFDHTPDQKDEIWIIDNGSKDGSVEILKRWQEKEPERIKPVFFGGNTGTTFSRNVALRGLSGRYVVVIDSDVVKIPPGTFETLIARLEEDERNGMVVPMLTYPDGRFQLSTDVFPTLPRKVQRYLGLKAMERAHDKNAPPTEAHLVDYAISAFWFLRREAVEAVGVFDEEIFYSPEDVDYCLRVWEAGYRIVYEPAATVVHDAQEISRGLPIKKSTFSHMKGLAYLFRKHGYVLSRKDLYGRLGRPDSDEL